MPSRIALKFGVRTPHMVCFKISLSQVVFVISGFRPTCTLRQWPSRIGASDLFEAKISNFKAVLKQISSHKISFSA